MSNRKMKELALKHAKANNRILHEINGHVYSFNAKDKDEEPEYYSDYTDYAHYHYSPYDKELWNNINKRKYHLRKNK